MSHSIEGNYKTKKRGFLDRELLEDERKHSRRKLIKKEKKKKKRAKW